MQHTISSAFSSTLFTNLYPHSTIVINLHVLSQDGSLLAACINAATLALVDAGIPMSDYVTACTIGSAAFEDEADPLLDLNGAEEQELPFLTIANSGGEGKVTALIMETRLQMGRLEAMIAVGLDGCKQIRSTLDNTVRDYGKRLIQNRVGLSKP
jgi:exosome complex component RRP41